MSFEQVGKVHFPKYQGVHVNMMPFVMGNKASLPDNLHGYLPMIEKCSKIPEGMISYLTVHESWVPAGASQRRPGIHTDATCAGGWGGGSWGGKVGGIYLASTDGKCRIWNSMTSKVNEHGALLHEPEGDHVQMAPRELYWITDQTPHEALVTKKGGPRQFFRLVSDQVSLWWAKHNTPNPLGIQPGCKILTHSKF